MIVKPGIPDELPCIQSSYKCMQLPLWNRLNVIQIHGRLVIPTR